MYCGNKAKETRNLLKLFCERYAILAALKEVHQRMPYFVNNASTFIKKYGILNGDIPPTVTVQNDNCIQSYRSILYPY